MRDIDPAVEALAQCEHVGESPTDVNLGTGAASIQMTAKEGLFFRILEEIPGFLSRRTELDPTD